MIQNPTDMVIFASTGGMLDWTLFDNSKLIMFDDWKVSFLKKKLFLFNLTPNLTYPALT